MADDFRLPRAARDALAALTPVVCPPDVGPLGLTGAVVDHAELMIGSFPAPMRAGLLVGLGAFEASRRLTFASPEAAFARWWGLPGPFHALAKGLKAILVLGYYEHPVIRQQLGYDADAYVADAVRRRQARFADDLARYERVVRAPEPLVRIRADRAAP